MLTTFFSKEDPQPTLPPLSQLLPTLLPVTDESNLELLSSVASAQPVRRVARRKPNPRCWKPGHSLQNKESIQRHTCFRCFSERAAELVANPHLTRWDVACVLAKEFRNYYCCCCILEACVVKDFTRVSLNKYCRNGHALICKEHRCAAHNQRFTDCRVCPDPRAGTSFHVCGARVSRKCNCQLGGLQGPQDPEIIELKEKYASSMLERARELQR